MFFGHVWFLFCEPPVCWYLSPPDPSSTLPPCVREACSPVWDGLEESCALRLLLCFVLTYEDPRQETRIRKKGGWGCLGALCAVWQQAG